MDSDDDLIDEDGAYTEQSDALHDLLRVIARAPRPDALPLRDGALPDSVARPLLDSLPRRALSVGEVVDARYRIEETLGAGGMGIVYGATQLATGRKVALKWMQLTHAYRGTSEQAGAFQRFLREAQATARIHHPNVVNIYDAGQDPQTPYLVMERLKGETLRARMDRGSLSWADALALFLPILQGVAEAHRSGVVHRDLKPDNVFLALESDKLVPKVLDFGVSRLRSAEELADGEPSLTRTGTVLGTPAYMPLEQLRGVGIDARTDVYALGVVLYEMLAGKRPYEARNAADFAALIACEPAVPLSRLRPELRGGREAAVMKALARRPEDRYDSAETFARALENAGERRPRRALWVSASALSLLAAGTLWALRDAPSRAPSPTVPATATKNVAVESSVVSGAARGEELAQPSTALPATHDASISARAPGDGARPGLKLRARSQTAPHSAVDDGNHAPAVRTARRDPARLTPGDFHDENSLQPPASTAPDAPSLALDRAQF